MVKKVIPTARNTEPVGRTTKGGSVPSHGNIKRKLSKANLLIRAGLRHSRPINLKLDTYTPQNSLAPTPILKIKNNTFDVTKKKSRDYYNLLISNKAQFPNAINNLRSEFHLSTDQLKQVFRLPHSVAFEPYVKAFQYKILNSILFTNVKLHKIGFIESDLCTFCETVAKTLHHLLFLYVVIQSCFGPTSNVIGSL